MRSSHAQNTIIGLLIVLGASVLNAFGLNLTKLDHLQNSAIPRAQRKKEYLRPLWLGGMGIYILSQVLGSPLALRYLRPDWVAPLGASSLIFNFVFAYFLVGTREHLMHLRRGLTSSRDYVRHPWHSAHRAGCDPHPGLLEHQPRLARLAVNR